MHFWDKYEVTGQLCNFRVDLQFLDKFEVLGQLCAILG